MHDVCAEAACIEFQGSNRCCLINQEIAQLRNEETAGELCLNEMVLSCLVTHTGQIAVVGACMRPDTMIFRGILAIPVVHEAEAVADCQHPGPMRIVELCVEIAHQGLLAVLVEIAGVIVVHLSADHQPEVGCEDGGVEFDKAVRIAVAHLVGDAGGSGVVAAYLGKENGIVLEGVGVGQHEPYITVVIWQGCNHVRVEDLLFGIVKLLVRFDDEPVARAHLPV